MNKRYVSARYRRALALLTAVSCFWLSTVGSVFHTHGFPAGQGARRPSAKAAAVAFPHGSLALVSDEQQTAGEQGQCLSCEWQANSVSAALPIFAVPEPLNSVDHSQAVAQSYIRLLAIRTASRAPPAA